MLEEILIQKVLDIGECGCVRGGGGGGVRIFMFPNFFNNVHVLLRLAMFGILLSHLLSSHFVYACLCCSMQMPLHVQAETGAKVCVRKPNVSVESQNNMHASK